VETVEDAVLIPQRCITERQGRHSVFVVGEGNKVSVREVQVGPTVNGSWLIREGLKAGEKIVYEGLQRVKEGTIIQPEIRDIQSNDRKET
jgi:membrane fusion protein (multidrug efflux system)